MAGDNLNVEGSGHAQMPIVGHGFQINNFVAAENHDVVVLIAHERTEIDIDPDRPEYFSVEVTNHRGPTRRLSLRVEGVPAGGVVEPAEVTVSPERTARAKIVLRCTPTDPEAGQRHLRVRAIAVEQEHGQHLSWLSEPKKINVPARPRLSVSFTSEDPRISLPTKYPATLTVENCGNTRLSGTVRVALRETVGSAARVVHAGQINFVEKFELGPGTQISFAKRIEFHDQGWRARRWVVPILATVDRKDVEPALHEFVFHQFGVLSDLPLFAAKARSVIGSWGGQRVNARRGVLVIVFALLLAIGVLAGGYLGGSPTPASQADSAAPVMTSSVPTTGRSAGPPPQHFDINGSTSMVISGDVYTTMPCDDPRLSVVVLATMAGPDADFQARYTLAYERVRTSFVAPEFKDLIQASTWEGACRTVKGKSEDPSRRFVWLGPVSADWASGVCERLDKGGYDCYSKKTA